MERLLESFLLRDEDTLSLLLYNYFRCVPLR